MGDFAHSTEWTRFSWSSIASTLSDFEREGIFFFPNPSLLVVAFSNVIRERSHYIARGAFAYRKVSVKKVCLSKKTTIQKCLHELLNNHIDVVILWCNWDFDSLCIVERDKCFCFKSHHIITYYRPGQMLSLPAGATRRNIGLNWLVVATFPQTNSTFFQTYINDTTCNHITVFGPVMRLCQLKRWIFLDRQRSPACGSWPPHWIITFLTGEITVS